MAKKRPVNRDTRSDQFLTRGGRTSAQKQWGANGDASNEDDGESLSHMEKRLRRMTLGELAELSARGGRLL